MPLSLRPYQGNLKAFVYEAWGRVRCVQAVLPTGGGKTITFADIIHDHDGASVAVVHRREIVAQISLALGKLGVVHRIVAPSATVRLIRRKHLKQLGRSFIDQNALAGVASVQTLTSKSTENDKALQNWLDQITLGVFDEGHHYVSTGLWARAVERLELARLLFVTATPERADGKGLGVFADGFIEEMVFARDDEGNIVDTRWLIDQGYLSPFKYYAPDTDLDVSGVAITKSGDFNAKALRERTVESHLVGDCTAHYVKLAPGKRAIGFASDVATAEEMAAAMTAAGFKAVALNGSTDQGERERELDRFEQGANLGVYNVDLFDEGFDVPAADAAILGRPTMSLAKFLQMVGRVLRPVYADGYDLDTREGRLAAIAAGPKPFAVIIDPVRNWERHGMPDWPRDWTLTGRTKTARGESDTIPQRVCVGCTRPYEAFYPACPFCGHEHQPPERSSPSTVDGDLQLLDVDALAALFAKKQAANMSEDDYRKDQIARNIPSIGRGADMKRFKAAKYRRQVLHKLLGWWGGAQQGRSKSEVQRRFFLRFGVDVLTAFTLNAKDTDELIARIQKDFGADIK